MSKGNTPRTLWEIMINTPDVLQLCSSSVHFTIKFYKASRHPAGCIHCGMASSAMAFSSLFVALWDGVSTLAFCSISVALHYSLPQIQTSSIFFFLLLDTAKHHIFLSCIRLQTSSLLVGK